MIMVTQKELAEALGISTRRIRQMKTEGYFELPKNSKKYNLAACVKEYITFRVEAETKAGTSVDYDKEHAEHERVKKETAKLKLRRLKNELHETKDVENFLSDMLVNFKNHLLSIPSKLSVQLQGEEDVNRIKQVILNEMLQTLDELSEYDPGQMDTEEDEEEEEEDDEEEE